MIERRKDGLNNQDEGRNDKRMVRIINCRVGYSNNRAEGRRLEESSVGKMEGKQFE